MRATDLRRFTEAEYLELDAASRDKHEFANGEVVDMSGVSIDHSRIQRNLIVAISRRLEGRPCEAHGSDLRVHTQETGLYAYPDLVVHCGPPELTDTRPPSLLNPCVIVEVLSASTAAYDAGPKAAHYRHCKTVKAILLVDSQRRYVQTQTRNADGTWTLDERTAGQVAVAAINVVLDFDEIYRGVATEAPPPIARKRRSSRPG